MRSVSTTYLLQQLLVLVAHLVELVSVLLCQLLIPLCQRAQGVEDGTHLLLLIPALPHHQLTLPAASGES
jgi:hypothetical protein